MSCCIYEVGIALGFIAQQSAPGIQEFRVDISAMGKPPVPISENQAIRHLGNGDVFCPNRNHR